MRRARRSLPGYALEHRLGQGASSTVWRARQLDFLDRPVAVKRVRVTGDADASAQVRADAAVLATLDHPHIVRVFEVVADGDDLAIAMQLAAGGSLDERLARCGPMAVDEATDIVAKLAAALGSAHHRGVVHRDIKPANVLFTSDGEPLLADFGLASDDGLVRGTEPYLDPTVRSGRAPDVAADLYALGVMAFEMVTGRPPLAASDAAGLGGPLGVVVRGCLVADPAGRFATAAEIVDALQRPAAPAHDPPSETRTFGPRPPRPSQTAPPSDRWRVVVAAAGLGLFVGGATLAWSSGEPSSAIAVPRPDTTLTTTASPTCPVVTDGTEVVIGDVDGDGCVEALPRSDNVLERDGARFALGEPGDVPVLGDWDCDGVDTPGVFRAGAGVAHLFDGWAGEDDPRPAVRSVAAASPPTSDCR